MNEVNPYAPPSTDAAPGFDPSEGLLASRASRFGAALLDAIVLLVVLVPIQYAMGMYDGFPNVQQPGLVEQLLGGLAGVVAYTLINGRFLSTNGQTLGKKALGIRIVNMDDSKPSLMDIVLKRYVPFTAIGLIPMAGPFLSLINVCFIFGSAQRCGHDLVAGTKVIRA